MLSKKTNPGNKTSTGTRTCAPSRMLAVNNGFVQSTNRRSIFEEENKRYNLQQRGGNISNWTPFPYRLNDDLTDDYCADKRSQLKCKILSNAKHFRAYQELFENYGMEQSIDLRKYLTPEEYDICEEICKEGKEASEADILEIELVNTSVDGNLLEDYDDAFSYDSDANVFSDDEENSLSNEPIRMRQHFNYFRISDEIICGKVTLTFNSGINDVSDDRDIQPRAKPTGRKKDGSKSKIRLCLRNFYSNCKAGSLLPDDVSTLRPIVKREVSEFAGSQPINANYILRNLFNVHKDQVHHYKPVYEACFNNLQARQTQLITTNNPSGYDFIHIND
uniref:CNDH2_C domain-containing protein n=1 Tax=Rhabditophanes sp. KR3021 TaxID=114890 RepID=A0AC35TMJ1_9BILA